MLALVHLQLRATSTHAFPILSIICLYSNHSNEVKRNIILTAYLMYITGKCVHNSKRACKSLHGKTYEANYVESSAYYYLHSIKNQ